MRILDSKHARDLDDVHDEPRGTPGRSTLTSRLPPAASAIASAVVRELQAKGDLAGDDAHEVAAYGMAGAGNALPFVDQIQRAFGHHDISGVRAHIGGRANEASSALGASAYASGDSVAFGASPDLHLAAHEAAHVVQQRGGVRLSGGLGRAGDEYEVNADAVADRVVRGESAQDLLDPFSHRGRAGGSAVQRQEHEGSAGVRDLDRMLLGRRPNPAQVVACMRRHPDDARAILARVHERLGDAVAMQVELEVNMTAPELVPVLGSPRAHGTSPVGAPEPHGDAITGGPHARPREAVPSPVDLHGDADGITATAHPDAHSTVEATVGPGEVSPVLREVRVVIDDATHGGGASAELEVGADLEEERAHASVSGELHPDGEDGPTLSGELSVSAGSGEEGGVDVRGSGRLEIRVPVGDHATLREALILTDDHHLRVEAGAEVLLQRIRELPAGNAARGPLLRLFMTVDTDTRSGERTVSGGASLDVQFDRDSDDHGDAGDIHQLAKSGTSGGGSSLPHLSQIQTAFGHHDVSGLRAHIGGAASAATGAMGARGFAYGDDVAFASAPDLHLAAHEAAHVVQQRGGVRLSGGVGRAGDEYEKHADAVADLVVRGESAQGLLDERAHRGAAGGPAVQRDEEDDRAWLATLHRRSDGHYTAADGRELTRAEQNRLRRILRSEGASRRPRAEMTEGVDAHERHEGEHVEVPLERTAVDEERERAVDETGTSHGHSLGGEDAASGGRTRRSARLADRARSRGRVETIDERRSQEGTLADPTRLGERVERHEHGTRSEALHGPTLEAGIHDRLVRARDAAVRAERAARGAEALQAARDRLREIDRDIAAITAPGVSRTTAMEIAERHDIRITMEEDVTTTTTTTDVNPLGDGSVGTSRRRDESEVALDGSGRSSSDHRSTRLDVAGGAAERRHDTEETETAADGSSRTGRTSRTDRVAMGDGRLDGSRRRRVEAERTDEDGEERRRAREREVSAGAIISEDETGGRFALTDRTESEADGTSTAHESSTVGELTDRRIGGSHTTRDEYEHGDTRASGHVSADGSFSIDVTPMEDGSGRFRLTFTIHAGAGTEGTASHGPESGDGRRGSITGRASASGDLITEHVISEADAQRYLDAAHAADRGEAVSDPPEFGRLARLRAAGEGADAMFQSGAVLGDGGAAAAMADGDSLTLDTTAGIGGDASLHGERGGMGATVEAGGDMHWRRTVQVERITVAGHPRVRLTVSYHDDSAWHAGVSASVPDAAARFRHGEESGATDSVQFVIDPDATDYDARYSAIVRTTDRAELRALETRYAEDVRRSRHATTGAEETEYEGGPSSSAMVGLRERTTRSDDVSTVMDAEGNPAGLEADISGGTESDLRVRARDHDVDVIGSSESVHGTVDRAHGTRVDIEEHEDHIDPLAAIADGAHALSEADTRGRAALVLAHTPSEHLMNALQQFSASWGYHLGESDLESMSTRAGNPRNWSACCIVPDRDVLAAWSTLRSALAHPRPDAAESRADPAAAINIARIRALSTWMQNASGHGTECIEHVLRRWGESETHEVDAERLGSGFEWPVSLRATHETYNTLLTQTTGFRDRMDAALARPTGNTEARDHFNAMKANYDSVLSEVRACSGFTSEARRSEMIREIEQHRADVYVRYRDFERRWAELHPSGTTTAAPTADAIEATRASGADITAERSRAYVRAGIRVLQGNHTRETQMLQQIQSIMRDVGDSPLFGNSERAEAATICGHVHDLHRTWIQQIEDLRQAYTQAGTPESSWEVSPGPGAPRHRALEPNVGWLIIEYRRAMQNCAIPDDWQGRIAQWRREGDEY